MLSRHEPRSCVVPPAATALNKDAAAPTDATNATEERGICSSERPVFVSMRAVDGDGSRLFKKRQYTAAEMSQDAIVLASPLELHELVQFDFYPNRLGADK